jgi:hypothetical protein
MAERDPIDVLREQLNGLDGLTNLHADHEAFTRWHGETKTDLEKTFSPKSIHCQSFAALRFREMSGKFFSSPEIDKINAARYKRDLETARNILQGAIKELTLDRTLFKKIQTTPKTVEVALKGDYFVSPEGLEPQTLQAIDSAYQGSGLNPSSRPEINAPPSSFQQRLEQIKRAKFGIYDLSAPDRSQSLLELGAALALGRETILICRKGSVLPEAVHHLDRIEYEDPSDLTGKLRKKIRF